MARSRAARITRRAALVGAVAVAGGVAFGTWAVRRPHANPLAEDLPEGAASFNPWVIVDAERVTLVTPHADIGQGAVSMQAMLVAEEMDLAMDGFETSFGPPSPAYWNRAFADEGAPFPSTDRGPVAEAVRAALSGAIKLVGVQATGGSTSVPDSWQKLREAGAVARETLKAAAAAETGHPVSELTTKDGAVILPDGSRLPYTALAARAATLEPVTEVTLRAPSEWRLIGREVMRRDVVAKSTGTQDFGIDVVLPGMKHAALRLSPRRGTLGDFDATAAEAMAGVERVVEITGGLAVIASDTWTAMQAAQAIDCTWGPAPYPAEQAQHWEALAEAFTDEFLDREWRHDGDVPEALDAPGAQVLAAEYRAPYVAHQPLEPLNATALVQDGTVELWAGHQMPRFVQQIAAEAAGIEPEDVTFHNRYAGGSFGHRLEFENIRAAVEVAAAVPGTPVKLTYRREEDFARDFPRQVAMGRARGTVRDGAVEAADYQVASPSVTRSQMSRLGLSVPGPDLQIPAGLWNATYAIPHYRVRAYAAQGLAPVSSWRSVGASTAGFFGEGFLDELIHAAGADPLEARLAMSTVAHHRATLEAVAEMCSWSGPRSAGPGRGRASPWSRASGFLAPRWSRSRRPTPASASSASGSPPTSVAWSTR